jgi:dynein intermediate chain 1, axonemal
MTITLKLSPNLRLKVKPPKKQQHLDHVTLETQKLDRVLSLVREVPQEEVLKETASSEGSN